jgi:hypothetical protein
VQGWLEGTVTGAFESFTDNVWGFDKATGEGLEQTGDSLVSDQDLAGLERQIAVNREGLPLRAKLYVPLGRLPEKRAWFGANLLARIFGKKPPIQGLQKDQDLALLKDLPLRELNLHDCDQITDEGLKYLKDLALQSLNLSECHKMKNQL